MSKHTGAYEEFWCQYGFYLRDWVETLNIYAYLFPSECWAVPAVLQILRTVAVLEKEELL